MNVPIPVACVLFAIAGTWNLAALPDTRGWHESRRLRWRWGIGLGLAVFSWAACIGLLIFLQVHG